MPFRYLYPDYLMETFDSIFILKLQENNIRGLIKSYSYISSFFRLQFEGMEITASRKKLFRFKFNLEQANLEVEQELELIHWRRPIIIFTYTNKD